MDSKLKNLPNILTVIRIVLVPVTLVLIYKDLMIPALIIFIIAELTDLADGYIARHFNLITKTGIWLGPLADKLMAVGVIIMFAVKKIVPLWVLIVIFAKELIMIIGGGILLKVKRRSAPSNKFGKAASFILNVSIATGFLYKYWAPYYLYAIYFALVFAVFSLIQYAVKNGHMFFEPAGSKENNSI